MDTVQDDTAIDSPNEAADRSWVKGLDDTYLFLQEYRRDGRFMQELLIFCERYSPNIRVNRRWLRLRYYLGATGLYLDDLPQNNPERWDDYQQGCAALFREYPDALPLGDYSILPPCPYKEDLDAFVVGWGLDTLAWNSGYRTINDWCRDWHVLHEEGTDDPQSDEEMDLGVELKYAYAGEIWSAIINEVGGRRGKPSVRVSVRMLWDARGESARENEERIIQACRKQVRRQHERLRVQYEKAGVRFGDTRHARSLHFKWLFRRVAYRESCDMIAAHAERSSEREAYNPISIQKATKALAHDIGLRIPRPLLKR